jgi:hypothetical protein
MFSTIYIVKVTYICCACLIFYIQHIIMKNPLYNKLIFVRYRTPMQFCRMKQSQMKAFSVLWTSAVHRYVQVGIISEDKDPLCPWTFSFGNSKKINFFPSRIASRFVPRLVNLSNLLHFLSPNFGEQKRLFSMQSSVKIRSQFLRRKLSLKPVWLLCTKLLRIFTRLRSWIQLSQRVLVWH